MPPKKRCCLCRKLFRPDPRVGARQFACGEERCQRERRARTQASWRSRNPSYSASYRLQKRTCAAEAAAQEREGGRALAAALEAALRAPVPLRLPAVLASFPWDFARTQLGWAGADLLASLALLLLRARSLVKDPRKAETPLFMPVCPPAARDP